MDKFWENYITTRPVDSKGAFDAFKQMHQDPRPMAQGPRNMYADGQLVTPSVDGSRPGYGGKVLPPPDNWAGTKEEWEALDKKQRFRFRNPDDVKKWNIKRKEKGGDWFTSDFSKRKFDKSLLEKIEKQIVKENVKTGKTRTLTQLLTDSGVPIRMAKHPSLRENPLIKEATKDFLSLPQKVNNYLENVVLNADTVYDDIKYPMQHIAKKFSTDGTPLAHKTLVKYLEDNPLYKQNKNFLKYLGQGSAVYNKYGGTGKTIGDMMFIIDNRIPEPFFAVKGPDDFIMKSAYRSFIEGKQLGTGSSINFIGDPTMQNPSEWMFEHKGKIYAQNSALDKVDLPGDNRFHNKKINNLRVKNANKIYSKEFGEVYNIFDDLGKYRNTALINPRTGNQSTLDFMTREAYDLERGYPRDKIGVQIDHGKGLKEPFTNLKLMNREMNQTAGNIIRQHGKTNPKLAEKMLNEIGYNKPYNFDKFIKSETDRVVNVLNPKNFDKAGNYIVSKKPSMYSSAYEKVTKIKPPKFKVPPRGTTELLSFPANLKNLKNLKNLRGKGTLIGAALELAFYKFDVMNQMSKGKNEAEAKAQALSNATLGYYKNEEYMKDLKKVAEENGWDTRAFDKAFTLNDTIQKIDNEKEKYQQKIKSIEEMKGDPEKKAKALTSMKKASATFDKASQKMFEKQIEDVAGQVSISKAAETFPTPNLDQIKDARYQISDLDFEMPFVGLKQAAHDKLLKEKKAAFDVQSKQADPEAGSTYNWLTNFFTGAENFLDWRTKGQEKQRLIDDMLKFSPQELYRYNLQRGVDPDYPVTEQSWENLKAQYPGLGLASGGRAGYMGGGIAAIRKPHAIPPKRQGLRSIMINVNDD